MEGNARVDPKDISVTIGPVFTEEQFRAFCAVRGTQPMQTIRLDMTTPKNRQNAEKKS